MGFMKKLFVEELEPRNLLDAGGLGQQPFHWLAPDRSSISDFAHSQKAIADFSTRGSIQHDYTPDRGNRGNDPTPTPERISSNFALDRVSISIDLTPSPGRSEYDFTPV